MGVPPTPLMKVAAAVALSLLLAACQKSPQRTTSIGEAYVGPAVLDLRSDIPTQSSTVATVKHGDRVEILQRRRLFLKVRTPSGAEGWTDERQLLSPDEMTALKDLSARAANMPSQGQATVDAELRVHTQPAARSPGFLSIQANQKVDVLTHMSRPRTDLPRKPLIPPPAKRTKPAPKKPQKPPAYPPPPMPIPPGPPANWLDLSKTNVEDEEPAEQSTEKPVPTDDWSLVRTADGEAGWVLTRRLRMAIPDEVAQYAEGRRIVSYFSLGSVQDGDQKKDIWLWTTVGDGAQSYDFDSFRVFVWSLRRHRYETEYIERNLKGYQPVLLEPVQLSTGKGRNTAAGTQYPGFSVCTERKDGQRVRREFALLNPVIRFAGEKPCEAPLPLVLDQPPAPPPPAVSSQPQPAGFAQRIKQRLKAIFGR